MSYWLKGPCTHTRKKGKLYFSGAHELKMASLGVMKERRSFMELSLFCIKSPQYHRPCLGMLDTENNNSQTFFVLSLFFRRISFFLCPPASIFHFSSLSFPTFISLFHYAPHTHTHARAHAYTHTIPQYILNSSGSPLKSGFSTSQ